LSLNERVGMCALRGWKETFRDVGQFGYSRFEVKVRIFCVVLQGIADGLSC
jgi:hypothetical protein